MAPSMVCNIRQLPRTYDFRQEPLLTRIMDYPNIATVIGCAVFLGLSGIDWLVWRLPYAMAWLRQSRLTSEPQLKAAAPKEPLRTVTSVLISRFNCEIGLAQMKNFGAATPLFGTVSLMGAILVAQREYEKGWEQSATNRMVSVNAETIAGVESE
jgi:hypothetical protein